MLIENPKIYTGTEAENIFFRPSFCGESAKDLGIRVIYNMPMPTTVQVWEQPGHVLQKFTNGWNGGSNATKFQKEIAMRKVKAEMCFAAEDYFSMVYEKIVNSSDVNMGDLTGTELEKAETELFRKAIAEAVRATMWLGDESGEISNLKTFNGFFRSILNSFASEEDVIAKAIEDPEELPTATEMFATCWKDATTELHNLRSDGQLVYFVSPDIYNKYIEELDSKGTDSAYLDTINGHQTLYYHGIPIIEVPLGVYAIKKFSSFCLLTDRRNMVLALNTADMPENEVRMWYNPDQMENRQRAVFLAGAEVIDQRLVSLYYTTY